MTPLPSTPSRETATGVVTNGLEQRTTAHLNLTRSLADGYEADLPPGADRAAPSPRITYRNRFSRIEAKRRYERSSSKIPFAGKE